MRFIPIALLSILMLFPSRVFAKNIDTSFIREHLKKDSYSIDPDAAAVVLYEKKFVIIKELDGIIRRTEYTRKVIKILKSEGTEVANIHIIFPHDDDKNYIDNVHAVTYNLLDGKVDSLVMSEQDLLKKGMVKNTFELSFSIPSVKVGSVIDYTYQVASDRTYWMYTWEIQERIPKLWSEYHLNIPANYEFSIKPFARSPLILHKLLAEADTSKDMFCMVKDISHGDPNLMWVRKDVVGIKNEPYVHNRANHIERLEIQFTGGQTRYGNYFYSYTKNWKDINNSFWDDGVKSILGDANTFLAATVDSLVLNHPTPYDKISAIYKYVRGSFKLSDEESRISRIPKLKEIFNKKEGDVFEINVLLTAMLIKAGLSASPVLLTTTDHISPTQDFPIPQRINYLVAVARIDSNFILLDATDKHNTIGVLPNYCYNGYAWILGDVGEGIYLTPDVINDRMVYAVKMYNISDSGADIDITRKFGIFSSIVARKKMEKDVRENKVYEDGLKDKLPTNVELLETTIENEKNPDEPLIEKYKCRMKFQPGTKTLYIKDVFVNFLEENPFKATHRYNPIEFPHKTEMGTYMTIVLPEDMTNDSLAAPVELDYGNDAMHYSHVARYIPEIKTIAVNTLLSIKATSFTGDCNAGIRDFMQKVIDNNNSVLVLKKK